MARILFTTSPMAAHVRPTVPLVRELASSGHEVVWYTGAEFESLVAGAGASFVPAGVALDFADRLRGVAGRPGLAALNQLVLEIFLRPIPAFAADLADVFDTVRPEVVVADHSFRAGLFLAEQRGIARVAYSAGPLNLSSVDTAPFGTGRPPPTSALARLRYRAMYWKMRNVTFRAGQRMLTRIRADMGLRPLPGYFIDWAAMVADRYLQSGIPEFEYPRRDLPPSVRFVGPSQPAGVDGAELPPWWPDLAAARRDGRPVVFVTQGTISTDPANLVLPTIAALAGEDVLLVATTSGQDPDRVLPSARRPANLRLAAFVPYGELLPQVDLIVTNGGYGGVQTALTHGVPLVVSGTTEDRKETNARVAWCGAGVSLQADRPEPDLLRAAARRVLADPSYRTRARELKEAYAGYSGSSRATEAILEAAAGRRMITSTDG
jgi:MGT family glycosyltransferase